MRTSQASGRSQTVQPSHSRHGRRSRLSRRWWAVPAGFAAGSVPVSWIAAKATAGVDLRESGSGTVSGTGLHAVSGFRVLALAGVVELGKGALGAALAGRRHPAVAALAAGAAVSGHNWSPWLRGAGGRGISPAVGALLVAAPAGAGVLLGGLAAGRLAGATAVGCLAADLLVVPVSRRAHGPAGAIAAGAVVVPLIAKRLAGNSRVPPSGSRVTYLWRLLFDRDVPRVASRSEAGR